jgi:hypothetical protein
MPTNSESSTKVYKFSKQLSGLKKCGNVDIPGIANRAFEFLQACEETTQATRMAAKASFLLLMWLVKRDR